MEGSRSYAKSPMLMPYMRSTIGDRLRYHASTTPDKSAFILHSVDGTKDVITCLEIYDQSVNFAKGLLHLGIRKSDSIGISFPNCRNWLISTFACQMIGAIPFHFTTGYKDGRDILPTLKFSGNCTALIVDSKQDCTFLTSLIDKSCVEDGKVKVVSTSLPSLKFMIWKEHTDQQAESTCNGFSDIQTFGFEYNKSSFPQINGDDIAIYLTTSGTTGSPKWVHKSHNQLLNYGQSSVFAYEMKPCDVFFNDRFFSWIGGFPLIYLVCGSTHVTPADHFSLQCFKDICDFIMLLIEKEKCTVSKFLPVVILELLRREEFEVSHRQRLITTGGAPIPTRCAEVIGRFSDAFLSQYGSTEMNVVAYHRIWNPSDFSDYCVGKPAPGVEMKVVDHFGEIVDKNQTGELMIRNTGAFSGYFNDEKISKSTLADDGWFRTDDAALMNENGDFIVNGRCSDIIECYGALLSPSLIEDELRQHPAVAEVCVLRIMDPISFQKPCVCLVLNKNSKIGSSELEEFSQKDKLGAEKFLAMTRIYMFFDKFPKTSSGKVDRKELMKIVETRS